MKMLTEETTGRSVNPMFTHFSKIMLLMCTWNQLYHQLCRVYKITVSKHIVSHEEQCRHRTDKFQLYQVGWKPNFYSLFVNYWRTSSIILLINYCYFNVRLVSLKYFHKSGFTISPIAVNISSNKDLKSQFCAGKLTLTKRNLQVLLNFKSERAFKKQQIDTVDSTLFCCLCMFYSKSNFKLVAFTYYSDFCFLIKLEA